MLKMNLADVSRDDLITTVLYLQAQIKGYHRSFHILSAEVDGLKVTNESLKRILANDMVEKLLTIPENVVDSTEKVKEEHDEEAVVEEPEEEEKPQVIIIDGTMKDGFNA